MSKPKRVRIVEKPGPRLFSGSFPAGICYADRFREADGDYVELGFLPYDTLILDLKEDCPPELAEQIKDDARRLQSLCGQRYPRSASGQTVLLGECIATPCGHESMIDHDLHGATAFRCGHPGCSYIYSKADQPTV